MAGGWQVLLESEIDGVESAPGSGVALLYQQRHIDALAERLEVTPLSHFFSRDPGAVAAYLTEQGLNPADYDLPDEEWHAAEDGLTTVRALLEGLNRDASSVPQAEKVIADLGDIEQVLSVAALHGIRFHLDRRLSSPGSGPG